MTDKYDEIANKLKVVPKNTVEPVTEKEITMPNFYKWSVNIFKWNEDAHRHLANVPDVAEALQQAFNQGLYLGQREATENFTKPGCLSKLYGNSKQEESSILDELIQRFNKETFKWELYNIETNSRLAIRNSYEPFRNVLIDKDHSNV